MAGSAGTGNEAVLRVLVCGDRNWTDKEAIRRELQHYAPCLVIHGAARGADTLGGQVAFELGCDIEQYPADWEKHGKAAGPIRNQLMLTKGLPDVVLAFHSDIQKSKGTKHMVEITRKEGILCKVFDH